MKVIQRGTPPEEEVYQADCNRCHSKLEFTRSEAKFREDQREGSWLEVTCPVCNNRVFKNL